MTEDALGIEVYKSSVFLTGFDENDTPQSTRFLSVKIKAVTVVKRTMSQADAAAPYPQQFAG